MNSKDRFFCFLIYAVIVDVGEPSAAEKGKARRNSIDDELFPIYECDDRSRSWTKRCLVPLTNTQLSLDLCGTGEKSNMAFVKACAKELQILAESCPQPGPVSTMAKDMLFQSPPPASPPSYESFNTPKMPAKGGKKSASGSRREKDAL